MRKQFFSKGKRGIIYTAIYNGKRVAIKTKNPDSKAINRIQNESKFLKILNDHNIGPKLIKTTKTTIMYEFVEGPYIKDKVQSMSKKSKLAVVKNILKQCHVMDQLNIDKEEMLRPHKHIVLTKKGPVMLDFERCHKTEKPKNITQFLQYIRSLKLLPAAIILKLAKNYKKNRSLDPILEALK